MFDSGKVTRVLLGLQSHVDFSGAAFEGKLDPQTDIMAYTSALKAWFRSLPESAFTDALYKDFVAAARELALSSVNTTRY
jgi:hypothetical protein